MKLYNSLTRQLEEFAPINPPQVGMYSCGPTVYDFATIGNFRTYVFTDIVFRTLQAHGFQPRLIMNLTDVGHLTGDNLGDSSSGEDRLEKAAKLEGKTAWDIAKFYTEVFLQDWRKLNLLPPERWVKATEHIPEQIALIQQLEENGFTYRTSDGIYFDTSKFPEYGRLSTLDELKEGARVELNSERKYPADFALWKFSPKEEKRHMEWESPWGVGFPGWHIECSAMSMKYLGESFDIHIGGEDLRTTHHPNEIAQAEAVTGKPFVKYWLHGTFLLVDGGKMSKSLGNVYTVTDVESRGFDALALRYLSLSAHYRTQLNFTWKALEGAQSSLKNLKMAVVKLACDFGLPGGWAIPPEFSNQYTQDFLSALGTDFNTPEALAVMFAALESDMSAQGKINTVIFCDRLLGLNIELVVRRALSLEVGDEVKSLLSARELARSERRWADADAARVRIEHAGFVVEDTPDGTKLYPKV